MRDQGEGKAAFFSEANTTYAEGGERGFHSNQSDANEICSRQSMQGALGALSGCRMMIFLDVTKSVAKPTSGC